MKFESGKYQRFNMANAQNIENAMPTPWKMLHQIIRSNTDINVVEPVNRHKHSEI